MAEVWDAWDLRLERPVALKILHPRLAEDPAARARFHAEAKSAGRLSHPNIVSVYDTGEEGQRPWIVMERLEGETLASRIAKGPMPVADVLRLGTEMASALAAAHAAGLIHRDIKPGNILFGADGSAKVADFGIAKAADASADFSLTATNAIVGTPAYLAPERAQGAAASIASDIWSAGVVLYEALVGAKAFPGTNAIEVALAARQAPKLALYKARPEIPRDLLAAVERAMAVDPAQRFASASELAAALGSVSGIWSNSTQPSATQVTSTQVMAGPIPPPGGDGSATSVLGSWVPPGNASLTDGLGVRAARRKRRTRRRLLALGAAAALVLVLVLVVSGLDRTTAGRGGPSSSGQAKSAKTAASVTTTTPTTTSSTTSTTSTTVAPTTTIPPVAQSKGGPGHGGKRGKDH